MSVSAVVGIGNERLDNAVLLDIGKKSTSLINSHHGFPSDKVQELPLLWVRAFA